MSRQSTTKGSPYDALSESRSHEVEVSVADVIGYVKGKSAIHIARGFGGRPRNFVGQHFWARGYFVSTVGRDEQAIRAYIQDQEREDRRLERLRLDQA